MSTNVKSCWAATRLPCLCALSAAVMTPDRRREVPYLAALPALIAFALAFLTVSGTVLAVYYNPWHAFDSVQYIDRNVNDGWLIHAFHETGTTMIFGLVYLLLFRGLLTRPYKAPGELVWLATVKTFVLLLLVSWLGYTLTGGAASAVSLTNATNAALSFGGLPGALGTWFFGGPFGTGTLARVVVLHIAIALMVFSVIWFSWTGSKALRPKPSANLAVSFHPYYTAQYFVALVVFALIFAVLAFFAPHFGENHLNALPASTLAIPAVLTPPWYLAPLSAITLVLPGAGGAVVGVLAMLAVLAALPWLDRSGANGRSGGVYRVLTWILALDVIALGFAGAAACGTLVAVFTIWYFFHFLVLTPLVTAMEAE